MISKFGLCRVSTQVITFADSSSSNSEQRLSVENFQVFIKQAGNKLIGTTVNHVSLYIHASPYFCGIFVEDDESRSWKNDLKMNATNGLILSTIIFLNSIQSLDNRDCRCHSDTN